jgi:hypothetical protein
MLFEAEISKTRLFLSKASLSSLSLTDALETDLVCCSSKAGLLSEVNTPKGVITTGSSAAALSIAASSAIALSSLSLSPCLAHCHCAVSRRHVRHLVRRIFRCLPLQPALSKTAHLPRCLTPRCALAPSAWPRPPHSVVRRCLSRRVIRCHPRPHPPLRLFCRGIVCCRVMANIVCCSSDANPLSEDEAPKIGLFSLSKSEAGPVGLLSLFNSEAHLSSSSKAEMFKVNLVH